jgi:hypothetical protein
MSEGSTLITINPATLDDEDIWKYNDLRGLCKQLGLSAKGKRSELVDKLQGWHKRRVDSRSALALHDSANPEDGDKEQWIPLNVDGSNFSILSHNVRVRTNSDSSDSVTWNKGANGGALSPKSPSSSSTSSTRSRRLSLRAAADAETVTQEPTDAGGARRGRNKGKQPPMGDEDCAPAPNLNRPHSAKKRAIWNFTEGDTTLVSPTLLRPLTTAPGTQVTPGKSILKFQDAPASPRATGPGLKIHFSPFNGTKVIGNRKGVGGDGQEESESDEGEGSSTRSDAEEEDEEDEDWDENYVDEIARINAARNTMLAEGANSDDEADSDGIDSGSLWERID